MVEGTNLATGVHGCVMLYSDYVVVSPETRLKLSKFGGLPAWSYNYEPAKSQKIALVLQYSLSHKRAP